MNKRLLAAAIAFAIVPISCVQSATKTSSSNRSTPSLVGVTLPSKPKSSLKPLSPEQSYYDTVVLGESKHGINTPTGKGKLKILLRGADPVLSPDGKKVAFSRYSNDRGLWLADVDGKNQKRLTEDWTFGHYRWSPDGKSILYARGDNNIGSIWVMDATGNNPRQLTSGHNDLYPEWSPDRRNIVWNRSDNNRSGVPSQIWIAEANGKKPRILVDSTGDYEPKFVGWSADARELVYGYDIHNYVPMSSDERPSQKFFTVRIDGRSTRAVNPPPVKGRYFKAANGDIYECWEGIKQTSKNKSRSFMALQFPGMAFIQNCQISPDRKTLIFDVAYKGGRHDYVLALSLEN